MATTQEGKNWPGEKKSGEEKPEGSVLDDTFTVAMGGGEITGDFASDNKKHLKKGLGRREKRPR